MPKPINVNITRNDPPPMSSWRRILHFFTGRPKPFNVIITEMSYQSVLMEKKHYYITATPTGFQILIKYHGVYKVDIYCYGKLFSTFWYENNTIPEPQAN